jgi:hypothetical protein
MLGGLGSRLSGGKFSDGATTGAFGYMFNYLAHVHKNITMLGGYHAGLEYGQLDKLSNLVVDVDSLPDSQTPGMSHMHGMCEGGMGAAQCALNTSDYRNKMWNEKSPAGLAGLLHLDQDSFAPKHAGGQSYSGFKTVGEALSHGWSDRAPSNDTRMMLIERTRQLINNYNTNCNGCIKNGLR